MKQNLTKVFKKSVLTVATLCALFAVNSCTKTTTSSNDGAKFVGAWTGTSSCSGATTYNLGTGSDGNTVTNSGTIGGTGCVKAISLNIKANGNVLTMASQTFTDGCGNSYTFTGSGVLSGTTLTMTETVTGAITQTCTFTGHK